VGQNKRRLNKNKTIFPIRNNARAACKKKVLNRKLEGVSEDV
jgi:hypothetical protein